MIKNFFSLLVISLLIKNILPLTNCKIKIFNILTSINSELTNKIIYFNKTLFLLHLENIQYSRPPFLPPSRTPSLSICPKVWSVPKFMLILNFINTLHQ